MVSRAVNAKITPPKRSTPKDLVELMCERYWDAFRTGYCAVGGKPEDYPTWKQATDPVKVETRRCMRHAVEPLRDRLVTDGAFDDWFPDKPQRRAIPRIANDGAFVASQKIARMGE